jgi:aryl-alcohol dehydrogenase-like predicted oxidoreductase
LTFIPRLEENLRAASVKLSDDHIAALDSLPHPEGDPYPDM